METIYGLSFNGPAITATGVVFTVLAVTAVGLRFSSKRIANSPIGLDDWLLLASLVLYFTAEILVIRCKYFIGTSIYTRCIHMNLCLKPPSMAVKQSRQMTIDT